MATPEAAGEILRPDAGGAQHAIEPAMVRIPEGWFWMGSDTGRDDERPAHRVWVDAFELATCQVTNAEYACFLAAAGHPPPLHWNDPNFNHSRQPVVAPRWFDAVAYCEWLSTVTGRRYRLPTEAEWERAARGGVEGQLYPWGNAPPESLPDYPKRWRSGPEPAGLYAPNSYGLYNMCDNIHEWCADWYDPRWYARSPERNPQGSLEALAGSRRRASRGALEHPACFPIR